MVAQVAMVAEDRRWHDSARAESSDSKTPPESALRHLAQTMPGQAASQQDLESELASADSMRTSLEKGLQELTRLQPAVDPL